MLAPIGLEGAVMFGSAGADGWFVCGCSFVVGPTGVGLAGVVAELVSSGMIMTVAAFLEF